MATWLKQSTAIEIKLGPFVSSSDGFTPMTALTISQADVRLAKNEGDWAQKSEATSAVHEENGWYRVLLNTTDTNTLGILIVAVNESGALPVWREFMVMEGTSIAVAVWDEVASGHQTVGTFGQTLGDSQTGFTGMSLVDMLTLTYDYAEGITNHTYTVSVGTVTAFGKVAIGSAVWDEDAVAHQTAGTFGKAIGDPGVDTNTIYGAVVTGAAGATVAADIIAIQAKTGSLTFTVAGQVDANIESVNATTVTGSGTGGDPWGP